MSADAPAADCRLAQLRGELGAPIVPGAVEARQGLRHLGTVVAGVVVGGLVAAGVGYAVQEYGDDAAEAVGDVLEGVGDEPGDLGGGIKDIFS